MRPHAWIGLSDDVRLGVLTEQVTPELVDEALAGCGVRGWSGALSARFMVYFTLALALFHPDSYDDVAENLVGALDGMDEAIPNKSNFTRARARLGPRPLEAVFRALAGPLAPDDQVGSFWRGMRLAAIDGFVLDAPDTAANRTFFGGPSDARGVPAGFPQVRVVTLSECGTHASIDAAVGGFNTGEPNLAIGMAGSAAGMLVIADRAFPGVPLWKAFTGAGAHLLIRARSVVARRPIEVLPDGTYLARMSLGGQRASHPGWGDGRVDRVPGRRRGGDQAAHRSDGLAGIPCRRSWQPFTIKALGGGGREPADQDPSSAARPRCCARAARLWHARRSGRIWRCTTTGPDYFGDRTFPDPPTPGSRTDAPEGTDLPMSVQPSKPRRGSWNSMGPQAGVPQMIGV